MSARVSEFDEASRRALETNLAAHTTVEHPLDGRRHAAVAVVVVDHDPSRAGGGPAFLLTRRAPRLSAHAGQWALPGGRVDHGETSLDAALRELREELGLTLGHQSLLGRLDDYPTRSGYVVTPYVFWDGSGAVIELDPSEVQSVHRVPFRELQRADSPRFVSIPESDRPVVQLPIGRHLIHAPTGAVLLQFRRVALEGVAERVDHLEQPTFAWR